MERVIFESLQSIKSEKDCWRNDFTLQTHDPMKENRIVAWILSYIACDRREEMHITSKRMETIQKSFLSKDMKNKFC